MWEQVKKKKNRMQLHNKVILKDSSEILPESRAAGSGQVLYAEGKVVSDKWLGQFIKWQKAENCNIQGPGGPGKRHMTNPMEMGKNYDIFM